MFTYVTACETKMERQIRYRAKHVDEVYRINEVKSDNMKKGSQKGKSSSLLYSKDIFSHSKQTFPSIINDFEGK
jgi:hypothetical protein